MLKRLSAGDRAELDGSPVSLSGNSYRDYMHAQSFLKAGMVPGPPPKVEPRAAAAVAAQPFPLVNSKPSWLQEDW